MPDATQIPVWFKDLIFYGCLGAGGLLGAELIRMGVKIWEHRNNGGHKRNNDKIMEKFLELYERHISIEQEILSTLKNNTENGKEVKKKLEENIKQMDSMAGQVHDLHQKLILG